MKEQRLEELFDRYIHKTATREDEKELFRLLNEPALAEKRKTLIDTLYDRPAIYSMTGEQADNVYGHILALLTQPTRQTRYRRLRSQPVRWAVAASAALLTGIGGYLLFFNRHIEPAGETAIIQRVDNDVEAPKFTKATITLADGSTVTVDSLTSLTQNNVALTRTTDGKIVYTGDASEAVYNTLSNPKGSRVIDMQLADGSRVWLNAGSSVTYPIAFVGGERKVAITGEAYFEVAHDQAKPFYVTRRDVTVKVLGTRFNVNAYDDEPDVKVTLLEGVVNVSNSKGSVLMKPGAQVSATSGNTLHVTANVDVKDVMAWKNGLFSFHKSDLETVMRQLSRWYDVDIEYHGAIPRQTFGGNIQRTLNLSQVLKVLENSEVRFRVVDKKIIVMP